jgi:hypothetical protein
MGLDALRTYQVPVRAPKPNNLLHTDALTMLLVNRARRQNTSSVKHSILLLRLERGVLACRFSTQRSVRARQAWITTMVGSLT